MSNSHDAVARGILKQFVHHGLAYALENPHATRDEIQEYQVQILSTALTTYAAQQVREAKRAVWREAETIIKTYEHSMKDTQWIGACSVVNAQKELCDEFRRRQEAQDG